MRMTANTTTAASTVLPSEMAMSPPAVFFKLREAGSETSALAATTSYSHSIYALTRTLADSCDPLP